MEENLPFWEMHPADELVVDEGKVQIDLGGNKTLEAGAEVFARSGQVYAVYLPTANPSGTINLERFNGVYSLRWYNPRTGAFEGDDVSIQGGKQQGIGAPPRQPTHDWVVLLRRR